MQPAKDVPLHRGREHDHRVTAVTLSLGWKILRPSISRGIA